jgi:hypothetical protein
VTRRAITEPATPTTALLRHILDDSGRCRRAVALMITAALCLVTVLVVSGYAGAAAVASAMVLFRIRRRG